MKMWRKAFLICCGIWGIIFGLGFGVIYSLNKTLPSISRLKEYKPPIPAVILDRDGNVIYEFQGQRRKPVELTEVPEYLKKAIILKEDKRFYKHWGIDIFGVARAFLTNLRAGRVIQGASTITQQLARNLFLSMERTWIRKLKEAILAVKIERVFSKDEILEMYLTNIYFGQGAYGVEAAAEKYFGKHVKDLTLPECALLASLPRAPSSYNPFVNPVKAVEMRAKVLDLLAEKGIIARNIAEYAKNAPLGLKKKKKTTGIGPYFVEEVKKILIREYGEEFLYTSGAKIYTTLSSRLQKIAESVVKRELKRLKKFYMVREEKGEPLQCALLCMNPRTGEILAMVGGRDFRESMFNRATQALRQPGSAFKPFVWAVALQNGYTPGTMVLDAPIVVDAGDTIYSPMNYDRRFLGRITLRDALAYSRNLVSVRLIMKFSPEKVVDLAENMGIEHKLLPVISLALGSNCVTLLDMVTAYCAFANGGYRVKPIYILKIVDRNGNIIYKSEPVRDRVLTPQVAFLMQSMMQSVVKYGTARSIRRKGFLRPCAGKTGTTDDYTDAWFIGFTPYYVCGVWVGFDKPKTIGRGATGGRFAAPIWAEFMKRAEAGKPVKNFKPPSGIVERVICLDSGLLATENCPRKRREYFIKGTEPKRYCDLHKIPEWKLEEYEEIEEFSF